MERRRSRLALTLAEREEISRGVTARRSARSIAKLLGRSPSTVCREMSRNGGCDRYRATVADENAWARSRRPKCCKLATNSRLRQAVARKLRLDWSPEQIAGWLKRTHPEDEYNQVSHETIYQRSRDIRNYVLARAIGHCEGCKSPAPFTRKDGTPYLEPHHIRRVSDGGPDDPAFVVALCPNCHRRVHAGADGETYNAHLLEEMTTIEPD